ncbi:hypothetical protein CFD26_105006 [Aspergillus turcosus]|uniref:Uncharacterized protein n=1 Tax=Aspergillus turcosus TaxID=1245748 RepID=A0A3R7JEB4_9EURO|nr:hypothetical protein CFD26_105006 [Aspergillus turcosus]
MAEHIRQLMNCFQRRLGSSKSTTVDFNEYSNFLAFDAIGDFAFGAPFGFLDREEDHLDLIQAIDSRGEVLNALGHVPKPIRSLLKYFPFDTFWSQGLRGTKSLGIIGHKAYLKRKALQTQRKDILSFLFNAKDPETGGPLPEQEIIAESISFIVGGSDTTSTTMTNVVDIVSRRPEIQERLQKELDETFPGDDLSEWVADFASVEKLPVLNAVLRETMRVKPTSATGLERVTPEGGRSIAGKFIPAGTLVSVPTINVHYNSKKFTDPEEFRLGRWLEEDSTVLTDYFIPFSIGPRACIGRNFAWMEMLKTLATLFRLFDLERVHTDETGVSEGFFMKNKECKIRVKPHHAAPNRS